MRVLHVIASLSAAVGGPSRAVLEMAAASARQGDEVVVYATDHGGIAVDTDDAEAAGVEIARFPVRRPYVLRRSPALRAALADAVPRADVVHVHSLYFYHDWAVWRVCRRAGVPYVLRPHGSLDPFHFNHHRGRKRLVELAYQNRMTAGAALIHYTSEEERRLSSPQARRVPGYVVPLPIDMARFASLPASDAFYERFPEVRDRTVVLFYGRLNYKKGLDVLIEAFAQLASGRDDLCLMIAGSDDDMAVRARRLVHARGLTEKVVFTGYLNRSDSLKAFAGARVFALPSYTENFGISVADAMAAGLPVVISNKVHIWREVQDAGAGLVTNVDAREVADALRVFLENPERSRETGRLGRRLVAEQFSPTRVGERLSEMYAEAVRRQQSG